MKLKTRVILFFGGLGVFLSFIVIFFFTHSVRDSFKQEVLNNARINVETIEGTYYAFISGLKTRAVDWSSDGFIRNMAEDLLSKDPQVRTQAKEKFGKYVREQKFPYSSPMAVSADILDENGIIVASTDESRVGWNESSEGGVVKELFDTTASSQILGDVFVGGIARESEKEEAIIHSMARIFSQRKNAEGKLEPLPMVLLVRFSVGKDLVHVVSGELQEKEGALSGRALTQTYKTANVYLVSREEGIIASILPVTPGSFEEQTVLGVASDCLERGFEISKEVTDASGADIVVSSMCLVRDKATLVVKVGSGEAFSIYDDLLKKTYLGGGIIFFAVIVLVLATIRRPLEDLGVAARVANEVAKGDFSLRVNISRKDEIGEFVRVFNEMLDKISASRKELEESDRKIKEKSEQLKRDVVEHEQQNKFLEESKRAQLNLLEDAWKAKEKLEMERNRLQTILSSIADGLILVDRGYNIVMVNPRVVELFNMSREELIGSDLRKVVKIMKGRKKELDPAEWPTEEMFLTRKVVTTDLSDDLFVMTAQRSAELPITLAASPLGGEGGGAVIVIHDITEDRALDDAKSGFISVASHQLRTPLTTIRWYSEMLLSGDAGDVSGSQKDFLEEIHGGAERLYQTIDLLLGISRVESGKLKKEKEEIDIAAFTEDVKKELLPQADEKKLNFSIISPVEALSVVLDRLTLRQVVLNLVSNAIRYTNEGGLIEVRWWKDSEKGEVVYSVRDNGIGIPEHQRTRIFSKFFRAENALSKVPDGSGLGLALVKELVHDWGGRVWFETKEGEGTTFFFTVPLTTLVGLPGGEGGSHGNMVQK